MQIQQNANETKSKHDEMQIRQNANVTNYKCDKMQIRQNTKVTKCKNPIYKQSKIQKKQYTCWGIQTKCKFDKMQTDKMQKNDKMQIGQYAKPT